MRCSRLSRATLEFTNIRKPHHSTEHSGCRYVAFRRGRDISTMETFQRPPPLGFRPPSPAPNLDPSYNGIPPHGQHQQQQQQQQHQQQQFQQQQQQGYAERMSPVPQPYPQSGVGAPLPPRTRATGYPPPTPHNNSNSNQQYPGDFYGQRTESSSGRTTPQSDEWAYHIQQQKAPQQQHQQYNQPSVQNFNGVQSRPQSRSSSVQVHEYPYSLLARGISLI